MSDENMNNTASTKSSSQLTEVSDQEKMSFILTLFAHLANGQQTLMDTVNSLARHTPSSLPPSSSSNPSMNLPAIKFKELLLFKGKPEEVDRFMLAIQDGISIQ
jgi:hypothetical protein